MMDVVITPNFNDDSLQSNISNQSRVLNGYYVISRSRMGPETYFFLLNARIGVFYKIEQ